MFFDSRLEQHALVKQIGLETLKFAEALEGCLYELCQKGENDVRKLLAIDFDSLNLQHS